MAHKEPQQIERLVKRMVHDTFYYFVHIDAKVDLNCFNYLETIPRVKLIKNRIIVNWAGYSFVDATLECMKEIFASGIDFDFVNIMSAQDYPIKPANYIYNFFNNNLGKSFIAYEINGESEWWVTAKERIEKYSMADLNFAGKYRLQSFVNWLMPKRKFPFQNYTLYGGGGSAWWVLSKECADYFIEFMDANPKFIKFAKWIWCADEIIFPTIIMNSYLKDRVVNNNLRYIDWSEGRVNPKNLTVEDFDKLMSSDKLIARKFDTKVDTKVLDLLDIESQGVVE